MLKDIELFLENNSLEAITKKYTFKKEGYQNDYELIEEYISEEKNMEKLKVLYLNGTQKIKEYFSMAIMTHIACGKRLDLEQTFPEFKNCNPQNLTP